MFDKEIYYRITQKSSYFAQQDCLRIGAEAPRAPKNRSRAFSPLCSFSPPQFGQGSMLRIAL